MPSTEIVAAIVGLSTVAVALGGHLIGARSALNSKKLEVLFSRKADSYKTVLETAGEFASSPNDIVKYHAFQNSFHAAVIVASKQVADALDNPRSNSLHMNAQRLRTAQDEHEIERIRMTSWYESMESTKAAMREDLARLAEPIPVSVKNLWGSG